MREEKAITNETAHAWDGKLGQALREIGDALRSIAK